MKRIVLATVLISLLCTMFMAGCKKNTDNGLKDKLENVKEKTEEEDREEVKSEKSNESDEAKDDVHVTTMDEMVFNEDSFEAFGQMGNKSDFDNEAAYEPVFTEILDVINYGYNIDREYDYASGSLTEHINYGGMKDPLNEVGYRLEDISGDGVPELLIGYDADYLHDGGESYVTGIYTIKDGEPYVAYAGGTKGSCQRMDDTHFYSSLSGGVSLTIFGEFHLSNDGCDMLWDDCYFTDEKENGSIGFFHNKTGVIDAGLSEEMRNGDEIFNEIMDDLAYNCIRIEWTPIGAYSVPESDRIANFIRNSVFVFDQALLKAETCHAERMISECISLFAFRKS